MDEYIYPEAKLLNQLLQERKMMLAVAESCTGGWLGKAITDVSGSSASFFGGLMVYANEAKVQLLGVKPETLETFGAVSKETATEMVQGLLKNCDADIGLSITGVAGPAGGMDKKPVGTVWFALMKKNGKAQARGLFFPPGRTHIRRQSVAFSLNWLIDSIK